jgi:hypothetical protein
MELKDLVGLHTLTAVSNDVVRNNWDEDANYFNFKLDGVVYTVEEDPADGYRSMMKEIRVSAIDLPDAFPPQLVMGTMDIGGSDDEILTLMDVTTGLPVIQVGTENYDNYYPVFVANYMPENMAINKGK